MFPTAALLLPLFAAVIPLTQAQLPASAPRCALNCFQIKIAEAPFLAPGVANSDIAGLCATSTWFRAYQVCMQQNCVSLGEDFSRKWVEKGTLADPLVSTA
jgi:hypothetical protein